MSSYHQHLYHLVFRTKDSLPTINQDHVDNLYAYITGFIKNKQGHLYRINGVENHLHVLTDINPSIAPIDFMRDRKDSAPSELQTLVRCSPLAGARGYSYLALSEPLNSKNQEIK